MVRVGSEPVRLICPHFADGFAEAQTLQGLQSSGEVVGGQQVGELRAKLAVSRSGSV
jgi:hypothetical protein